MTEKKQIEDMVKIICDSCAVEKKHCAFISESKLCPTVLNDTEHLYNAGYRKQSEVIDEFAERLKKAPVKCGLPLFGLSTKEEIEEYFNGIMLQVRDAIDGIVEEMKGGAE